MDRTFPRGLGAFAVTAALAVVASACGNATPPPSSAPSPSAASSPSASSGASPTAQGSVDLPAVNAEINDQVRALRGLEEKTPIEPTIVSPEEITDVIRTSFDEDYPPEEVAADERLYHGLGLLAKDVKLKDVYIDLLESQVAGLYDPVRKKLYVVSKAGDVGPVEEVYYSHEYDHALQDQNFDLEAITDGLEDETDEALARQALVEGDAYVVMTYWLQQNLTPEELTEVIQSSSDPEAQQALNRIPPIVQAQLIFSAVQGTQFVGRIQMSGDWAAVDAAFGDPPQSTEQVLHPEKFDAREAPIKVDLPDDIASKMGIGWSVIDEDTMGEHQTAIWLGSGSIAAADDASAGWGGDRITILGGPDDSWAIAWHTVWDSDDDAAEFEVTAEAAVAKAGGPGRIVPGEGGEHRWVVIGSDDIALGKVANALGLAG
ncbi:MAG TPA: hypothetical protein VK867_05860 [Candidatus Limnocylindrales bacterium]|nr:hypothetical protein [Candidatus Limnocylindrales bacterium]